MLRIEDTILVVVDAQDKLLKIIPNSQVLISNIMLLAEFFKEEDQPIIFTKQVKLGEITKALKQYADKIIEKKYFSCMREEEFRKIIQGYNRRTIILTGIETHICIMQTALDMINEDYRVIIPPDAVASQINNDHIYALEYLRGKGVEIIPTEAIIYMLMESPEHRLFKKMLEHVKKRRREMLGDVRG